MIVHILRHFFDDKLRQVLNQATWMYAASAIVLGLQFAETLLIARWLSLSDFGLFIVLVAYPELVQQVLDFRTRESMSKFLAEFVAQGDSTRAIALIKLLWIADVAVSLLAYAIVFLTADFIARDLLHRPEVASLIQLYALGLLFGSLDSASGSVMRVFDRYDLSFVGSLAVSVLRFALVLWVLVSGGGLLELVQARVVGELGWAIILSMIALYLIKQKLWSARTAPIRSLGPEYRRQIWGFLVQTNLAGTLKLVVSRVDVLIIALFWPVEVVGIYKMAAKLGNFLTTLSDPLYATMLPNFARMHAQNEPGDIRRLGRRLTFLFAWLMLPLVTVMLFFPETIVTFVAGPPFAAATWPFVCIFIGSLINTLFFWLRPAILGIGRAGALLKIGAVASTVQLLLLFMLTPPLGALGAALTQTVYYSIYIGAELSFLNSALTTLPRVTGSPDEGIGAG